MNKKLSDFCVKPYKPHKVKLPIEITYEDRTRKMPCPLTKEVSRKKIEGEAHYVENVRMVSLYTCLKCTHLQLRSEEGIELTRSCGYCVYPKKASKDSRRITQGWKAQNELNDDGTIKLTKRKPKPKRGPKRGGYQDKVGRIAQLIHEGAEKSAVKAGLLKKFPSTKSTTFNTMWYAAQKLVREDKVPTHRIIFPDPPVQAHVLLITSKDQISLLPPNYKVVRLNRGANQLDCPETFRRKYLKALKAKPQQAAEIQDKFRNRFGVIVMESLVSPRRVLIDLNFKVVLADIPQQAEAIVDWFNEYDEEYELVIVPSKAEQARMFFETFQWKEIEVSIKEARKIQQEKTKARRERLAEELGVRLG